MTWKGFLTFSALARKFSSPELSCSWKIFRGKNSGSFTSCSRYPSSCAQKFWGTSAGNSLAHRLASSTSSLPFSPSHQLLSACPLIGSLGAYIDADVWVSGPGTLFSLLWGAALVLGF